MDAWAAWPCQQAHNSPSQNAATPTQTGREQRGESVTGGGSRARRRGLVAGSGSPTGAHRGEAGFECRVGCRFTAQQIAGQLRIRQFE